MMSGMMTTERSSTLGYKLRLLKQSLMLQLNFMSLDSNFLCNLSAQYDEGQNLTPVNACSYGYTIRGFKNKTDSKVLDYLKTF